MRRKQPTALSQNRGPQSRRLRRALSGGMAAIGLLGSISCSGGVEGDAQTPAAEPKVAAPIEGRLVAIGDLHGDSQNALRVLKMAGLVDEDGKWTGGTTILVQTGDTIDRGPDSKGVLDLLRRLVGEAEAAGGRVVPLLGNHEVMNLQGDWRYVSEEDIASFGGESARRKAFAHDGDYAKWLVGNDAVALVGDTVFVHGGIGPTWARSGVESLNKQVREDIWVKDSPITSEGGPLWLRDFVKEGETEVCDDLDRSLALLGAARMVVGHTTQKDGRIKTRCEGRLVAIDVGISAHYGAHLAAWEQVSGDSRALYPSGPVDLPEPR